MPAANGVVVRVKSALCAESSYLNKYIYQLILSSTLIALSLLLKFKLYNKDGCCCFFKLGIKNLCSSF